MRCGFFFSGVGELSWSSPGRGLSGVGFFSPSGARLSLEANGANAAASGAEQQGNHKHCVLVAK